MDLSGRFNYWRVLILTRAITPPRAIGGLWSRIRELRTGWLVAFANCSRRDGGGGRRCAPQPAHYAASIPGDRSIPDRRIAAKLWAAWSALVTDLSESELPVPSDAQRRPPTALAHTRCSGQEHLQGTALNWQPLLTAKLLIQIGSHYPAPIAFDVHDVIPKLEQPPHPFGGASTQHYPRHRKRRQSI